MKEKNFKFRESFGALVEKMTDKQAGEFIKAVSGYVFGGKPMESKDEYLKGVYLYVQNVLDTEAQNREHGKIGGAIVAEKYKEIRSKIFTKDQTVSESNILSQLIIVSADAQSAADSKAQTEVQTEKAVPKKRGRRPKTVNAYNGVKNPTENKDDHKAV